MKNAVAIESFHLWRCNYESGLIIFREKQANENSTFSFKNIIDELMSYERKSTFCTKVYLVIFNKKMVSLGILRQIYLSAIINILTCLTCVYCKIYSGNTLNYVMVDTYSDLFRLININFLASANSILLSLGIIDVYRNLVKKKSKSQLNLTVENNTSFEGKILFGIEKRNIRQFKHQLFYVLKVECQKHSEYEVYVIWRIRKFHLTEIARSLQKYETVLEKSPIQNLYVKWNNHGTENIQLAPRSMLKKILIEQKSYNDKILEHFEQARKNHIPIEFTIDDEGEIYPNLCSDNVICV